MSEEYVKKSLQKSNTAELSHYNKRVEDAKSRIDSMIASLREKIDLKEETVLDSILRGGSLELEDGTIIGYHDMVSNGKIQESSLSIFSKDHKSHWEINGAREQYQIFNTEYGDKKVKTSWGEEIDETLSSRSQQYNGTTVISIDNKKLMKVVQNEISGFETIDTIVFSPTPEKHSLFLKKGDSVEYKGDYDFDTIKRSIYDIRDIRQMQEDGCIFNEERLNGLNRVLEHVGRKPEKKSEEEIQNMLQTRTEILKMCNPLLDEAQQVIDSTLEQIKNERSISTKARKIFGKLLAHKSLQQVQNEKQKLAEQEQELHNEFIQINKDNIKKDDRDEK